jgi:imidazolonepropionase-like amidohydrolase
VGGRIELGNGKSIPKGNIIIRGGKIAAVGANASVPAGITTYDATGTTVYPGFIDGFSTTGLKLPASPDPATPPNTTVTAPPTMWEMNRKGIRGRLNAAECLDLAGVLSDAHKAGITVALLSPGAGLVRGRTAIASMTDEKQSATPFGIGLSYRGSGGTGYPGTPMGYTALLRQTLADAQTYATNSPSKEDLDLKGITPLLKKETFAVFAADSEADIFRAFKTSEEFGFPFLVSGGREAYQKADQLAAAKIPVLVNIAIGTEPDAKAQPDGPPQAILDERRDQWRERAMNVMVLEKAKVKVAFSSDASGFDNYLGNVRKLIKLGLDKNAALRAMTMSPAEIFGMEKTLGSIEPGKTGNIVVMTGDFSDEKSTVKATFVNGKKFEVAK